MNPALIVKIREMQEERAPVMVVPPEPDKPKFFDKVKEKLKGFFKKAGRK